MGDFWHQWVIRVRICQQRADGKENFRDRQRRGPLILEDVQADATGGIAANRIEHVFDRRDEALLNVGPGLQTHMFG
jgi:hypothetical protein